MSVRRGDPTSSPRYLLVALGFVLVVSAGALAWLAANDMAGLAAGIGAVLAAITAWIVVPMWRGGRRAREVRRWAREHGWRAESPRTRTIIGGTEVMRRFIDGIPVTSCTTEYDPDWRRGVDTTRFRHVVTSPVGAGFPTLTMVQRGGAQRAPAGPDQTPALGFEWAAFNAGWQVECADTRFAHDFCHPRLMERLMRPDVAGLSVLVAGGDVAVHAPGATALDAVEARAAVLTDLVRLVPPYLILRHQESGAVFSSWLAPTVVLRGAVAGETTGWPTVVMTTIVLGLLGWFVVWMARAGEVTFALWTVGVVAAVSAVPILRSRAVRRLRRRLR